MSQFSVSFTGANIPKSYTLPTTGWPINLVTIYNNTPAQLAVLQSAPTGGQFPYGGQVVPAFYPITLPEPAWASVTVVTDGTVPFSTSSLLIVITDSPYGSTPLSPFGPSGWGAGGVPNSLVNVNPGDPLLAWQVQQIINLLTGVMTGQVVTIADTVEANALVIQTSNGLIEILDRDGIGGDNFQQFVNAGLFRIKSSALGSDVLNLTEGGNLAFFGQLLSSGGSNVVATPQPALGSTGTAVLATGSTDTAGTVSLAPSGSGINSGSMCLISFNATAPNQPRGWALTALTSLFEGSIYLVPNGTLGFYIGFNFVPTHAHYDLSWVMIAR